MRYGRVLYLDYGILHSPRNSSFPKSSSKTVHEANSSAPRGDTVGYGRRDTVLTDLRSGHFNNLHSDCAVLLVVGESNGGGKCLEDE